MLTVLPSIYACVGQSRISYCPTPEDGGSIVERQRSPDGFDNLLEPFPM